MKLLKNSTLLSFALTCLVFLLLQIPFFNEVNNLFLDKLQGQSAARTEIVIVEIDDASLQSIGSWPWNRSVFADAVKYMSSSKPSVVGFDVTFLEPREGDAELIKAVEESDIPIVFASKLVDREVLKSIYKDVENSNSGFVNFFPDNDGKIRTTVTTFGDCELSLSLALVKEYFLIKDNTDICGDKINLRNFSVAPTNEKTLKFEYTKQNFTSVSFKDIYEKKVDQTIFKDKIVLIGSTALDLRSDLNDNFTSIFGTTIPGVELHANIVNSYLNKTFYSEPSVPVVLTIVLVITLLLSIAYVRFKKITVDFGIFLTFLILNIGVCLILFQYNILWPVLQISILLIANFVFTVVNRYFLRTNEFKYLKQAFGRYLSPKLMGQLLADPSRLKLGGETKRMTVLFSDIRSFTTISEKLSPEGLISMINDYLSFMTKIILEKNGTVDKYIGDAIMAIWNAPLDDPIHEENAIITALEMEKSLKKFNNDFPDYPPINVGIGINTGDMVVGNVGGVQRFDYTVLGDNVNLGARLEGLTKKYSVTTITTEFTMKGCTNLNEVMFRFLDEVIVKGKEVAVKIYEPSYKTPERVEEFKVYNKAFEKYQKGDFKEAKEILKDSKDGAAIKLLERIEGLIANPPKEWNGVWKWEEK